MESIVGGAGSVVGVSAVLVVAVVLGGVGGASPHAGGGVMVLVGVGASLHAVGGVMVLVGVGFVVAFAVVVVLGGVGFLSEQAAAVNTRNGVVIKTTRVLRFI